MLQTDDYKSVSFGAASVGILTAMLSSAAGFFSGGLGLGVLGLLLFGPVLAGRIWGRRAVSGAALAALLGFFGLGLLQALGEVPPALFAPEILIVIAVLCWLGFYTFFVLYRLMTTTSAKDEPRRLQKTGHVTEHQTPNASWLLIEVTRLGRIRRREGNASLLAEAQIGRLADEVLLDSAQTGLTAGQQKLRGGEEIFVEVSQTDESMTFLILPMSAFGVIQNGAAEQKLRDRTDFFAGLGHDLKSPLNAVIGFSDMMLEEIRGPMPEPYREYAGLIRESGQTLLRLVEDMLGYARSEAGTFEIDQAPIDIAASGETVMRQSQADAERVGVRLELKSRGEVLAFADAGAVQRIWDNLVSNAIKYSPSGGLVTLSARQRDRDVILSVTDRGAGMDADDLERIAAPFEQGRNSRGKPGTGLGLAMVQRLAELHGGQMIIRTAPGEGTEIAVTLPLAQQDRRAAE